MSDVAKTEPTIEERIKQSEARLARETKRVAELREAPAKLEAAKGALVNATAGEEDALKHYNAAKEKRKQCEAEVSKLKQLLGIRVRQPRNGDATGAAGVGVSEDEGGAE